MTPADQDELRDALRLAGASEDEASRLGKECECVECCDGEHAGFCKDCAGWGSNDEEETCSRCHGDGICSMCDGLATVPA